LNSGLDEISDDVLDACRDVLPSGDYVAALLSVQPRLVQPGTPDDYFANEYRRCTNHQRDPQMVYYRSRSFRFVEDGVPGEGEQEFHELIVPLYPPQKCDARVVAAYREALSNGARSAALAISVLDLVGLSDWAEESGYPVGFEPDPKTQWVLTHYLLDGHHKTLAASQELRSIQLLTFLRKGQGAGHESFTDNLYRILASR
jgi:hypothetical protein